MQYLNIFCSSQGRAVLEAIRGTSEVDAEYGTIINAYRRGMVEGENQLTTIMRREYRPHVAMSVLCPLFQQVHSCTFWWILIVINGEGLGAWCAQ